MTTEDDLFCGWTIYRHPLNFPQHYAVRMWTIEDEGVLMAPVVCLCDTLEEARECVPAGAILFPRETHDDPVIVESWI